MAAAWRSTTTTTHKTCRESRELTKKFSSSFPPSLQRNSIPNNWKLTDSRLGRRQSLVVFKLSLLDGGFFPSLTSVGFTETQRKVKSRTRTVKIVWCPGNVEGKKAETRQVASVWNGWNSRHGRRHGRWHRAQNIHHARTHNHTHTHTRRGPSFSHTHTHRRRFLPYGGCGERREPSRADATRRWRLVVTISRDLRRPSPGASANRQLSPHNALISFTFDQSICNLLSRPRAISFRRY